MRRYFFILVAVAMGSITVQAQRFVKTFDNYAAMQAANVNDVHTNAFVAGYSTANDGGQGTWTWVKNDTTASDGGTVLSSTSGGAGRWKRQYSGAMNVCWFGAKLDGIANDTTAIQNTLNAARASLTHSVFIPGGTALISVPLLISTGSSPLRIYGEGLRQTVIKASAAMSSILSVGSNAAQTEYLTLDELRLDGNSLASYGIYGSRVDEFRANRVDITGTVLSAVSVGYGWDNIFTSCEFAYNIGNGITLNRDFQVANNGVVIQNCFIFGNGGNGILVSGAKMLKVVGCTLEANALSGIYAYETWVGGGIEDCYFEQNSSTGLVFTTPNRTIKSDIVLNGSSVTNIFDSAFPCDIKISGNFTVSTGLDSFVTLASALGATLENNSTGTAGPSILVKAPAQYGNPINVSISNNPSFATNLSVTDIANSRFTSFSTWKINRSPSKNYLTGSVFDLTAVVGAGGGTVKRGDLTYNGFPTSVITNAINSDIFGVSLNLDNYPELQGQPVYLGAWLKQTSLNAAASVYANNLPNTTDPHLDTNWFWAEMQCVMPSTGSVSLGFRKIGGLATDIVYIANPILTIVGTPRENFYIVVQNPRWISSSAPTNGSWNQGDIIYFNNQSAGGKVGTVCVTSGEPGTWKSFGAIDP